MGDGNDEIWETDRNDTIFMGGDRDSVTLYAGTVANTAINLGTGSSHNLSLRTTDSADNVTMTSTTDDLTLALTGGATSTWTVVDAENISVALGKGNDVGTFAGVTTASGLGYLTLLGEDGNDTLTASPKGTFLYGGSGTNTFNFGAGLDSAATDSDTINVPLDSTIDYVDDYASLRFGNRTIVGFGGSCLVATARASSNRRYVPCAPGRIRGRGRHRQPQPHGSAGGARRHRVSRRRVVEGTHSALPDIAYRSRTPLPSARTCPSSIRASSAASSTSRSPAARGPNR